MISKRFLLPLCLSLLLATTLLLPAQASAQGKKKAEKSFLKALNRIISNTRSQHWAYEDSMIVVQPFRISPEGILSVLTRYFSGTGSYLVRFEVPLSAIREVDHDIYIILVTGEDEVKLYDSPVGSDQLKLKGTRNLFHVGLVEDEGETIENLRQLWESLKKHHLQTIPVQ